MPLARLTRRIRPYFRMSGLTKQWSKAEAKFWGILLFIGTVCAYAARVSLPICAVQVGKTYSWSKKDSGTALSSFFWGYAITQVAGGWLADKWGGEYVLLITSLGWSLVTLLFAQILSCAYWTSHPLAVVVFFRMLMGASQGVHFPSLASLTARHLAGVEKSKMLGILMAGSHGGTVLCGGLGSVILDRFGWEAVFSFVGGVSILWWLYLKYTIRLSQRRVDLSCENGVVSADTIDSFEGTKAPKGLVDVALPISPTKHRPSAGEGVPWSVLFRKVAFWAAIFAHYCGANAFFTLFSWMPTYFIETYPDSNGWVFNFIPNLAIVVTSLLSPSIATSLMARGYSVTFVRKLMEGLSQCGMAMMLFAVSYVTSFEAALFCITLALAFRGLHHAGVAVNAQDFAPNHAGAVFGFVNTSSAIPGFVGVYIAGFILDWTHSWAYVFYLTGVMCLCGASAFAMFGTGKQLI